MTLSHVPSFLKNRIEKFKHWPVSIKTNIEWFPFLDIMEYTGNDMISDIPLTTSLLKMFSMFGIKMNVGDFNVDEVSLMCINCRRKKIYNQNLGRSSMIK